MIISILYTVTFILCAGIASGSITLAVSLRKKMQTGLFASLLYFLAFYFMFGFYAIWGQVIMVTVLKSLLSAEIIHKANAFLVLLGSPFFLFAWLLLIRMILEGAGKKPVQATIGLLAGNILLATGIVYLSYKEQFDSLTLVKVGFIALTLLNTGIASALYLMPQKRTVFGRADRIRLAGGMTLFAILQCVLLWYFNYQVLVLPVFMLAFFAGGAFLPVYFTYAANLSGIRHPESRFDIDDLGRTYDISAREKDVVREICNGLTNQQIADKLFISLQTVKDHTSRIYYKTNCSSRAQLMAMVQESVKTKQ